MPHSIESFVRALQAGPDYQGQVSACREIPGRQAPFADPDQPIPEPLASALKAVGIAKLYTHQVQAVNAARQGKDIVVVTSTASGKTLCYNLPVLERLQADPAARAMYVFPTKALAQDQLRGLMRLAEADGRLAEVLKPGVYDGDTTSYHKRKIRSAANLVLTNPDMLHAGILPCHTRWATFFHGLKYVVLDEIHAYRGIFGSNVACVLRRLQRICRHYGCNPQFICCSATIANPRELAERLTGRTVHLIDDDGSPSGRKFFMFWNPPHIDKVKMERRSTNVEAQNIFTKLMRREIQTIAFTKARVVAELIYRYACEELGEEGRRRRGKGGSGRASPRASGRIGAATCPRSVARSRRSCSAASCSA